MPSISLRLSHAELEALDEDRGEIGRSEWIRGLIGAHHIGRLREQVQAITPPVRVAALPQDREP